MVLKLLLLVPALMWVVLLDIGGGATADEAKATNEKVDCEEQYCGKIRIPYPFGMLPECYRDKAFEIECNQTTATAFIRSIKAEVLQFSPSMDSVGVKGPITSSGNCSRKASSSTSTSTSTLVNLTGSPFMFSNSHNVLVGVGCNTIAYSTSGDFDTIPTVSCKSTCSWRRGVVDWTDEQIAFCVAENCCLAPLQPGLQVLNPSVRSLNNNNNNSSSSRTSNDNQGKVVDDDECRLAFAADRNWLMDTLDDPGKAQDMEYVTLSLVWLSNFSTNAYQKTLHCEDYRPLDSTLVTAVGCGCNTNFQGNPYSPQGCADYNECDDPTRNTCRGITRCVNTYGGFKCEVSKLWITVIGMLAVFSEVSGDNIYVCSLTGIVFT
ncbi:hypothetical protein Tsubulata_036822 [Turnera subulata]|uniref:EGF-like calcium-binding domain-containing protein n=1 Tax=Turnera subulata TaxID=218843 RepID=A0A9Q0GAY3_9ROSI|nr:hypothetical protein Tsubulata_036822 [Turnera subulata]